jgi:hypothetical protein
MGRHAGTRRHGTLDVLAPFALAASCIACQTADPKAELTVSDVETYWVLDSPVGSTQYIAPAVRFRVTNKGSRAWSSIQTTATFRRRGEEGKSWGSDWKPVTAPDKSLAPREAVLVVMRSDGRYYSSGNAESMFHHDLFRDAKVEIFLRIGASAWTKFWEGDVERRIGTKDLAAGTPPTKP